MTVALQCHLKSNMATPSALFFLLRIILAIWVCVCPQEIEDTFSDPVKNGVGIMMGLVQNLQIAFSSTIIYTILVLLVHEHRGSFYRLYHPQFLSLVF